LPPYRVVRMVGPCVICGDDNYGGYRPIRFHQRCIEFIVSHPEDLDF
jgi:hypothetical protein